MMTQYYLTLKHLIGSTKKLKMVVFLVVLLTAEFIQLTKLYYIKGSLSKLVEPGFILKHFEFNSNHMSWVSTKMFIFLTLKDV